MDSICDGKRLSLLGALGELPSFDAPIRVLSTAAEGRDGYVLERLVLDLNGLEPVPALLARPRDAAGKLPAVVFNHSHGGFYDVGKRELIEGAPYLQPEPYAKTLTELGVAALAIDAWGFGERRARTESEIFKEFLWRGRSTWGMMVYDSLRAARYLASRDDIDADRIGTMGMSMGGTMSWWLAALDERIRCCADLCGVADYDALIETQALDRHGIYDEISGGRRGECSAGFFRCAASLSGIAPGIRAAMIVENRRRFPADVRRRFCRNCAVSALSALALAVTGCAPDSRCRESSRQSFFFDGVREISRLRSKGRHRSALSEKFRKLEYFCLQARFPMLYCN